MSKMFLLDAQKRHRQNPESFWVPSDDELQTLKPGDFVKVCNGMERFWVEIQSVKPEHKASAIRFTGVIYKNLISSCADVISFQGKHIYAIDGIELRPDLTPRL